MVPVPIHPKRKKKRGYNQVTLFGKAIASALNVPYEDQILIKTGITKCLRKELHVGDNWITP